MRGLIYKIISNGVKNKFFTQRESPKIVAYIIRSLEIKLSEFELDKLSKEFGYKNQEFIDYYKAPIQLLKTKAKYLISGNHKKIFCLFENIIDLGIRISIRFRDNFETFLMGASCKFYFKEYCRVYFMFVKNNLIYTFMTLKSEERFNFMNLHVRTFQFKGYKNDLRWQDSHIGKLNVISVPFGGQKKK